MFSIQQNINIDVEEAHPPRRAIRKMHIILIPKEYLVIKIHNLTDVILNHGCMVIQVS